MALPPNDILFRRPACATDHSADDSAHAIFDMETQITQYREDQDQMFDPFKRFRAQARRKLRRSTVSAVNSVWDAMLVPVTPAKRARKKVVKIPGKTMAPGGVKKQAAKSRLTTPTWTQTPKTSQSNMTVPKGAIFSSASHECKARTRSYRLYVPAAASAGDPMPLVVMLHGCGQSSRDFARDTGMNTLAEEFGFIVLYPAQTRDAHKLRCWNWYRSEDQERESGEPALIANMTRRIIDAQNVDPARVYVAGLSAGAAMALMLSTTFPDIFAAVGVHSGLAVGAAHDAASVTRAMQGGSPGRRHGLPMPTVIFHGDRDNVVHPRNGRYVSLRALEPYGSLDRTERTGMTEEGRRYTRVLHRNGKGRPYVEQWTVHGSGHAWSGGVANGIYTDATGPDASRAMVQFFLRHRTTKKRRKPPPLPD